MEINERGYWEGVDLSQHLHDEFLAHAILHLVIQYKTVDIIDIGCGNGWYTKFFRDNGVPCNGYDGNPNTPELSNHICGIMDFAKPVVNIDQADVVLCLEVGEHVPKRYEEILFNNIAFLANKTIILSWALPGQNGFGHVNCQSNDYIVDKIEAKGFRYNFKDTTFLRSRAYRTWFKRTTMVFNRK